VANWYIGEFHGTVELSNSLLFRRSRQNSYLLFTLLFV